MVSGCGTDVPVERNYPEKIEGSNRYNPNPTAPQEGLFGPDGIVLFGNSSNSGSAAPGQGIGVNGFLWRASLDTLAFMPLASADPFGGVIITDWYSSQEAPQERFKATVYILDRSLRADGIKVSVFRQQLTPQNTWVDTPVSAETGTKLENAILTRARQLRIETIGE
ncbi:DUF3576 domain-containing protein [Zavarzinia sp. CC-PAN008]|uniref:DUF3576 domain-containing protein n=1 Tax=Zavarzinia sp. CC-PAN008 TaxID=3243332 RepID=UPI003F7443ED